jgi:hypothetical protein
MGEILSQLALVFRKSQRSIAPSDYLAHFRSSESVGKSSLTISAKPVGVGAASQPWILAGEQAGIPPVASSLQGYV